MRTMGVWRNGRRNGLKIRAIIWSASSSLATPTKSTGLKIKRPVGTFS